MKNLHKVSVFKIFILLFSFSSTFSMNHSKAMWQVLNGAGCVGSAASFVFWAPATLLQVKDSGITGAIISTHIPRLIVDATCIIASIYNDNSLSLNTVGLLGSAASLYLWWPTIMANIDEPLISARGAIDIAQIILCGGRLYNSL